MDAYQHTSVPRTFRTALGHQQHQQQHTNTPLQSNTYGYTHRYEADQGTNHASPFQQMSMGDYANLIMVECGQRGLHTTATFIGELTMSLSNEFIAAIGQVPSGTATGATAANVGHENFPPSSGYSPQGGCLFSKYANTAAPTPVASPAPRVSSVLGSNGQRPTQVSSIIVNTVFMTALSLFNKGLYRRTFDVLNEPPRTGTSAIIFESRRAAFLGIYGLYLEGEKQKFIINCGSGQSNTAVVDGLQSSSGAVNPSLAELTQHLLQALSRYPDDSYLLWLLGVVYRAQQRQQESVSTFLDALKFNPLLWCAWEDLAKEVTHVCQLADVKRNIEAAVPPDTLPFVPLLLRMFSANVYKALALHAEALVEWDIINNGLVAMVPQPPKRASSRVDANGRARSVPGADDANDDDGEEHEAAAPLTTALTESYLIAPNSCPYVQQHLAASLAGNGSHPSALAVYRDLHTRWPARLHGMDEYSHTLFLTGDRLGLSTLAQAIYSLDPFSAQANVAVGNYYAVMRKRDRSVYYFKRAVHIDPTLVSAWTLLGHEYLEVKNPNAAAEAYRAGLLVEKRDYRAWYSLGQIYELHHMYPFALHYFWRTVQLKPHDPRMWQAAAAVLLKLNRIKDMVRCLECAEQYEPKDTDAYADIVRTLAQRCLLFDPPKAMAYMVKLMACEGRKEDDEVHFLPMLVKFFTLKAKKGSTRLGTNTQSTQEEVSTWLGSATEYLVRLRDLIDHRSNSVDHDGNYSPTRGIGGSASVSGAPPLEQLLHTQALRLREYEDELLSVQCALDGGPR